ncbi:YcxB family protein [Alloacidobacterium sp.]|uniref:YcxB family protein n=1 Tax=Alloacidobacterium sp. TaxID=2951999 RepID=UPI002D57DD77|nr:YcxB family protein [Alloacidobacterium sp.]HYK37191.1 YcxB family protein [Alloacidobacterium sp.]
MQVRTEITPDELTQAIRLNRSRMYWPKVFLANWYATLLLIVILSAEGARLIAGKPIQPASLGLLLIPAFLLWLYWFRTQGAVRKAALELSDTKGSASIDGKGISASFSTGATSFMPWSEYSGWKEGEEVFTLTKGKSFRVFTKRGLDEAELEQLRGIFRTQIS